MEPGDMDWLGVKFEMLVVQYPTFGELRDAIIPLVRDGYYPLSAPTATPSQCYGQMLCVRMVRCVAPPVVR